MPCHELFIYLKFYLMIDSLLFFGMIKSKYQFLIRNKQNCIYSLNNEFTCQAVFIVHRSAIRLSVFQAGTGWSDLCSVGRPALKASPPTACFAEVSPVSSLSTMAQDLIYQKRSYLGFFFLEIDGCLRTGKTSAVGTRTMRDVVRSTVSRRPGFLSPPNNSVIKGAGGRGAHRHTTWKVSGREGERLEEEIT